MIWPSLAMLSYSWIAARRYLSSSGLTAAGSRPKVPWREGTLAGAGGLTSHADSRGDNPPRSPAWPQAATLAHMGACGAVPQICNLTQVLRQVILMLSLRSQLQVPAERVQPHRVGSAVGEWDRVGKMPS